MARRRVVLTGATGYVAQRMYRALDERWDLVPIDVRDTTRDGRTVPRLVVADLTVPDRATNCCTPVSFAISRTSGWPEDRPTPARANSAALSKSSASRREMSLEAVTGRGQGG
jgi:nucleoside-diphosphate-sugar epimerase